MSCNAIGKLILEITKALLEPWPEDGPEDAPEDGPEELPSRTGQRKDSPSGVDGLKGKRFKADLHIIMVIKLLFNVYYGMPKTISE